MWVKLDDNITHHPKLTAVHPVARWLWVAGLAYCAKYLSDGLIPDKALRNFAVASPTKWADRLVEVGLWHRTPGGYRVHDYHEYNPSAEVVKERRKKDRERKAELSEAARNGG